ncbi:MAG TPA: hypothetical protein G4O03_06540 [Dehalococcoidia bacterium]|jgi:hypothetical protein|nr:hypothetical protein [Dehalococcoidia bacterium]
MRFRFLPLGLWRHILLVGGVAFLALAGWMIWEASQANWAGLQWVEIALIFLSLLAGVVLLYLFASVGNMFVMVGPDYVKVKASFLVDESIPMDNIEGVEPSTHSWLDGIGVRVDFAGTLAIISATRNIVQLNLKEPQRLGFITLRLNKTRRIKLSLEDPEAFRRLINSQVRRKE